MHAIMIQGLWFILNQTKISLIKLLKYIQFSKGWKYVVQHIITTLPIKWNNLILFICKLVGTGF